MVPKNHPADVAATRIVAVAERFEITLFRGHGAYASPASLMRHHAVGDDGQTELARQIKDRRRRPGSIFKIDHGAPKAQLGAVARCDDNEVEQPRETRLPR